MKLSAIKKADGKIWLAHGDTSFGLEAGDSIVELPADWVQPCSKVECMKEDGGEIVADLVLVRAAKMEDIRAERDKRLVESDADYVKDLSMSVSLAAVNALKQDLRDLPAAAQSAVNALSSAAEIESYEPTWP
jgi:hypothetical protein